MDHPDRGHGFWSDLFHSTCAMLDLDTRDVRDELALASCIRQGLRIQVIDVLLERGVPKSDVFPRVISRRSWLRRRRANEPLSPDESERVERLVRALALANMVLGGPELALQWLSLPRERFRQARPLDLLSSGVGARIVEATLVQAYFGNVA